MLMLQAFEKLNASWLWLGLVQATIVALFALALVFALRHWSPRLRHAILLIALLKFIVFLPITIDVSAPLGFPAQMSEMRLAHSTSDSLYMDAGVSSSAESTSEGSATASPGLMQATVADEHNPVVQKSQPAAPIGYGLEAKLLWACGFAYILGVLFLALKIFRSWLQVQSVVSRAQVVDSSTLQLCDELTVRCGLRRKPSVLLAEDLQTPFATGLWKPTIVLPAWAASHLNEPERRCVIAHEMNHIRRFDLWVEWLQRLVAVAWWPHPCVWVVSRELRRAREECCDDAVLVQQIDEPSQYAQALVLASRFSRLFQTRQKWVPKTAVLGESSISKRIRRVVNPRTHRAQSRWQLLLCLVIAASTLPTFQFAFGQKTLPLPDRTSPTIVSGWVVNEQGEAVSGALLVSLPIRGVNPSKQVTTDANGEFSFDCSDWYSNASPRVSGSVYKPGYAVAAFDSIKQPLRIVLKRPETLEVRVRAPDGRALTGATVMLGAVRFDSYTGPPAREVQEQTATSTDKQGVAMLETPEIATVHSVLVKTSQWGEQQIPTVRVPFLSPSKVLVANLQATGKVSGRLLDPEGKPMRKEKLLCLSTVGSTYSTQSSRSITDDNGRFEFTVPLGRYQVVDDSDGPQFEPTPIQVTRGKNESIEIRLEPLSNVSGRVLSDLNEPAANVPVSFWRLGSRSVVSTNKDGYFSARLPAGNWSYECYPDET
ncbi:MAG TPA: hypothetical protein DDW52_18475, partial [Planctomycetaceae bacterium]|nr:hypothetical protein [Planctomycetaceae bacterium]